MISLIFQEIGGIPQFNPHKYFWYIIDKKLGNFMQGELLGYGDTLGAHLSYKSKNVNINMGSTKIGDLSVGMTYPKNTHIVCIFHNFNNFGTAWDQLLT